MDGLFEFWPYTNYRNQDMSAGNLTFMVTNLGKRLQPKIDAFRDVTFDSILFIKAG